MDQPIVFIDFGLSVFQPDVEPEFRKRCRIVSGWFDDANRMRVDRDELETAVTRLSDKADSGYFRRMLVGSEET